MTGRCAVLGFAAFSGTGKTTLLKQLIPLLSNRGLKIAVIKHTHHDIELDQPGKDSYELRHAGAKQTLLAGPNRSILITEIPSPSLDELLESLDRQALDLILVEGFREAAIPKIELQRSILARPFLFAHDPHIIAIASDKPENIVTDLPRLDLNNPAEIAEFIRQTILPHEN
ncbi:MAG: molybdopterin-guanine dinucleotide biosynthesis protein B [Thioalkalispiraceae bacterium]|jgi:molybdopterin-guanine dinucleotide biosynthesis protein MobB